TTIGKLYIVVHRFAVIRSGLMTEEVWSSRATLILTSVALLASAVRCIPLIYCGYSFANVDGLKMLIFFDDECVFVNKIVASSIYFTYS
ncbi:hypothetical protein PMAYCL1PPCAC_26418, partial [Pristionchus mayeri]